MIHMKFYFRKVWRIEMEFFFCLTCIINLHIQSVKPLSQSYDITRYSSIFIFPRRCTLYTYFSRVHLYYILICIIINSYHYHTIINVYVNQLI